MKVIDQSIIEKFDRSAVEATKGFLILSVILGHIRLLTAEYPLLFVIVNNFHVASFLLLPFIYDIRSFNKESLDIWFGRYLLPFIVFMCGYSVIHCFVSDVEGQGVFSWFISLLKGVFIATSVPIEQSVGMQSLWFLPALFLLVIVLGIVKKLRISFGVILVLGLGAHGVVGYVSEDVRLSIPFSAVSVAYIFGLGFLLRYMFVTFSVEVLRKYSLLFLFGWIGTQLIASLYTDTRIGFSKMRFQTFGDLGALLLHDGLIIFAMIFLLTTTYLQRSRILCYLGKYSLQIYLFHHFIYGVFYTMAVKAGLITGLDDDNAVLYGLFAFPLVTLSCVAVIEVFKRIEILPILFPRSTTALIESLKRKRST